MSRRDDVVRCLSLSAGTARWAVALSACRIPRPRRVAVERLRSSRTRRGQDDAYREVLLYGGVLTSGAGSVKAKVIVVRTSDWMEPSSSAASRSRRPCCSSRIEKVLNLLIRPTPRLLRGHPRVQPPRTQRSWCSTAERHRVPDRKLFEVCRDREIPIVTFINKWDRPGRDLPELLDEIEEQLILEPVPMNWLVGEADRRGLIDRTSGDFVRYTRPPVVPTRHPGDRPERAEEEEVTSA